MIKRTLLSLLTALAMACMGPTAFDPSTVDDATRAQIARVEPLCWWTGMKTPLQLMIYGPEIAKYEMTVEGAPGVSVTAIHRAESPNYLFVDLDIRPDAAPGTRYLVFTNGSQSFKYAYEIAAREAGSAARKSFTTEDMIYLIMPDRFANGDPTNDSTDDTAEKADREAPFGRHGGDIRGLIDHLDYISDLGATTVWCTPLLLDDEPRGSYHGYACADYYHIDPRFGDNALYRDFVDKAHEKGLKVIMDMVPNHCGAAHWWMNDLPFADWIHQFPEYTGTNHCFAPVMDPNASDYDLEQLESGWFVPSMPDMNLDNPYLLRYLKQWAVWWIEYAGLDGFRVDTYPYNEKVPMSEWCAAIREEYPEFNIVGECWTSSIPQLAYWQSGNGNRDGFDSQLPSIMDFPLYDAIRAALPDDSPQWGGGMTRIYDCLSHDFVYADLSKMLIFAGNHDTERIGDQLKRDPARLKIVMTLLATLRGIPQIFAGDELMFVSKDLSQGHGGLRVDFPGGWEEDSWSLFTEEGRRTATRSTDGVAVRRGQAQELYDHAARLFEWRRQKAVIHHGKTLHFLSRDNTYAYFRYDDREAVFVFVNNASEARRIPWSHYAEITGSLKNGRDVLTGAAIEITDRTEVAPRTALAVEFDRQTPTKHE